MSDQDARERLQAFSERLQELWGDDYEFGGPFAQALRRVRNGEPPESVVSEYESTLVV